MSVFCAHQPDFLMLGHLRKSTCPNDKLHITWACGLSVVYDLKQPLVLYTVLGLTCNNHYIIEYVSNFWV